MDADLELDITDWLWTLAGSYEVIQQESFCMNMLGDIRVLDLEETLQYQFYGDTASLPIEGRAGSSSAEETQWDAIVGVKGRWT